MSSIRSTNHPLFIRIGQRESILREVNPSSLSLESEISPDVQAFLDLFGQAPEKQQESFCASKSSLPQTFVKLFSARSTPEPLSLLCAFIDRLFDIEFNKTICSLVPYANEMITCCTRTLISHAGDHSKNSFMVRTVLIILGSLISESTVSIPEEVIGVFMKTVITLLSKSLNDASIAFEGLKRALRSDQIRSAFIEAEGIPLLLTLLGASSKLVHTDSLYHILFCFWALTFNAEGTGKLAEGDFIIQLTRLLATIPAEREEIIRLLVQIISQLNPSIVFIESAYDNDILRLLRGLQVKHYVDSQIPKMITEVADSMHKSLKHLSLWDKYVREVKSGKLRNSLSHRSDIFWKANIERFGDHNFKVLIELKNLLESNDEETVSVSCHDLGEYVSRHPLGRVKLEEIGAKEVIMRLMTSKSQAIQTQALRTTQLMLLRTQS